MNKLRLNTEDMKCMTLFENLTGARARDYIKSGGRACFIVEEGDMGLAIGKNGINVKKVRQALNTNIMVIEYSPEKQDFIRNIFHPVKLKNISFNQDPEGNNIATINAGKKDRGRIIGEGGYKIKLARQIAARHHDIQDINLKIS